MLLIGWRLHLIIVNFNHFFTQPAPDASSPALWRHVQWVYRGYYTAERRYDFYLRVVRTIFYKRVSKILFIMSIDFLSKRCLSKVSFSQHLYICHISESSCSQCPRLSHQLESTFLRFHRPADLKKPNTWLNLNCDGCWIPPPPLCPNISLDHINVGNFVHFAF